MPAYEVTALTISIRNHYECKILKPDIPAHVVPSNEVPVLNSYSMSVGILPSGSGDNSKLDDQ